MLVKGTSREVTALEAATSNRNRTKKMAQRYPSSDPSASGRAKLIQGRALSVIGLS